MIFLIDYMRDSYNLLKWYQKQLEPFRSLVKVTDLTTSWKSGLALCALIHHFRPQMLYAISYVLFCL